jgi:hypothetical protein
MAGGALQSSIAQVRPRGPRVSFGYPYQFVANQRRQYILVFQTAA